VAAFGQKLRGGEHLGSFGWAEIGALAQTAKGPDPQGERAELVSLVRAAAAAEALPVPPR
jgi:Ca-activated chloride channel family protein